MTDLETQVEALMQTVTKTHFLFPGQRIAYFEPEKVRPFLTSLVQEKVDLQAQTYEVLKEVEFKGHGMDRCPFCAGWNVDPQRGETPYKHTKDCKLAKLLAALTPSRRDLP